MVEEEVEVEFEIVELFDDIGFVVFDDDEDFFFIVDEFVSDED